MTVGESIQKYRKSFGMSQEELGQKLLVSRQTISLWEKDQTVPTIDNLMRLKEVFGVSVDEILDAENKMQLTEDGSKEAYCFHFTKTELNEIYRLQRKAAYKRPVLFILASALLVIFFIASSAPDVMIGCGFGILFMGVISHIKGFRTYSEAWKNRMERVCKSTYEYKIFEDYITVNVYCRAEKIRESKCCFTDIEHIQQLGKWLFIQFNGQAFMIRKSDLKENSAFYSYMYKNPTKILKDATSDKRRVISMLLFVASLLSILGALVLVSAISSIKNLFVENMWLFFLMTPIPVLSIVYGFLLKAKGYKYKKNIVAGIIMTLFLCIYGSFSFMF